MKMKTMVYVGDSEKTAKMIYNMYLKTKGNTIPLLDPSGHMNKCTIVDVVSEERDGGYMVEMTMESDKEVSLKSSEINLINKVSMSMISKMNDAKSEILKRENRGLRAHTNVIDDAYIREEK